MDAPESGPRCCSRHVVTYVLVRIEADTADEDFDVNALCAARAALDGLEVPGSMLHRVTVAPTDGEKVPPSGVRKMR